jgi:hypothetical protein
VARSGEVWISGKGTDDRTLQFGSSVSWFILILLTCCVIGRSGDLPPPRFLESDSAYRILITT